MSKLIIYYSLTGKNRQFAEDLAEKEKGNLIEFAPGGYLRVFQFFFKGGLKKRAKKIDTNNYNEIIIYGPVWGGKPAPAVLALLNNLELKGKDIECHLSHTGNLGETESIVTKIINERNGKLKAINFNLIKEEEK